MAGHSKWAQIKRQKGINDVKRGALFTKIGNQIAVAARGGADPTLNPNLAMVIEKAKAANMPLSNIERAIQRAADKNAAQLEEITYEGYGPGGVAVLVECATDNRNRTYPEVKLAFSKTGGSIAEAGSVAFQFSRKGSIRVKASGEDALLTILDCGAEDANEEDNEIVVTTQPNELAIVRDAIKNAGLEISEAELTYIPNNTITISDSETAKKIVRLMDALDELDDVSATHTNFEIADNVEL